MAKMNYKKFFKNQEVYKATEDDMIYVFSPYAVAVSDIYNEKFLKEIEGLTFADSNGKEKAMIQFIKSLDDCKLYSYTKSPFVYHEGKGDICFLKPDDEGRRIVLVNNRYIEPFENQTATIQVYNDDKSTVMIADSDNGSYNYILPIRPVKMEQFKAEAQKIFDGLYL